MGHDVLVGGTSYRVIGVMAKQGRTLGPSRDTQALVPSRPGAASSAPRSSLDMLVRARGGVPGVEASMDEVRAVMRALRHTDSGR